MSNPNSNFSIYAKPVTESFQYEDTRKVRPRLDNARDVARVINNRAPPLGVRIANLPLSKINIQPGWQRFCNIPRSLQTLIYGRKNPDSRLGK